MKKLYLLSFLGAFIGLNGQATTTVSNLSEIKQSNGQSYKVPVYSATLHLGSVSGITSFVSQFKNIQNLGIVNAANVNFQLGWGGLNAILTDTFCPNYTPNALWPGLTLWTVSNKNGTELDPNNPNITYESGAFAWGTFTGSNHSNTCGTYSMNPLNSIVVFQALGPQASNYTQNGLQFVNDQGKNAVTTLQNMIQNIIQQADSLGLDAIIIPGISMGLFSSSQNWADAMQGAIQDAVFIEANKPKSNLKYIFLYWYKTNPWSNQSI